MPFYTILGILEHSAFLMVLGNGTHLTSATSAIAPPLFLPRPESMYKYVLHFFCPAPNLFSTCTTTFESR